jgi:hypothetical protein
LSGVTISNDDGEPLGVEYLYDEDLSGYDYDDYPSSEDWDEEEYDWQPEMDDPA